MALRCAEAFPPEQSVGEAELSVLSAVTESTLYVKFYFNNIGPFIIRSVISSGVSIQCEQNARRGQRCKENRGRKVTHSQSR
jgi:hypothetical protein